MIFKTSQKSIELNLPENKKQVIIKMSGGADSAILAYCFALYKKQERPDLQLYAVTVNSVPPKNYHVKIAKRVIDKITELTVENKYPPITPAYVLFGLILVNFGPLNIFPKV